MGGQLDHTQVMKATLLKIFKDHMAAKTQNAAGINIRLNFLDMSMACCLAHSDVHDQNYRFAFAPCLAHDNSAATIVAAISFFTKRGCIHIQRFTGS